ncbi:respiratory nitrate reductase subunit gamma, partial [bacterium]|nr:respiratory nitrate reductase subunit gamma [bacterium]
MALLKRILALVLGSGAGVILSFGLALLIGRRLGAGGRAGD